MELTENIDLKVYLSDPEKLSMLFIIVSQHPNVGMLLNSYYVRKGILMCDMYQINHLHKSSHSTAAAVQCLDNI